MESSTFIELVWIKRREGKKRIEFYRLNLLVRENEHRIYSYTLLFFHNIIDSYLDGNLLKFLPGKGEGYIDANW